jgi:molybdopterin-containing oxidoreductase family membrane subunit
MAFNPGKNNPKVLVPGLVPSPLGKVVNYAPSWVEVSITLGILALGIFVVSLLVRPALIIEQRYEEGR